SAPQPINCPSDYQYYGYACAQTGLVTALNASLGFFPVPPPTPAGDSVSLDSSGLYSRIVEGQSGYYYGVNVLETGVNAQNQPIATRLILSTGVNAWDLGSFNGGFSRNVSGSIELVSSDGLNFTLDTSRSWPAGFGFNYQSDTNKLTDGGEVCVEGSWGTSNNSMWVISASGVWNPTESKAQFQLSISGSAQGGASVFAVNSEGTSYCSNYGVGGPSTASISLEVYLPPQPDPQPTPTPTPLPTPTPTPVPTPTPDICDCGGFQTLAAGKKTCPPSCKKIYRYKPKGEPKNSHCVMTNTGDKSGAGLTLAKVYDFDKKGADITFVFRPNNEYTPKHYDMTNDKSNLLNPNEIGYQGNTNLRVAMPTYSNDANINGDYALVQELSLYNPKGGQDNGDNGSFRISPFIRNQVENNKTKYPKLSQIMQELDRSTQTGLIGIIESNRNKEINNNGYFVVGVNGGAIYSKVMESGTPASVEIKIGFYTVKVKMAIDPKTGAWVITCA
ncbi:hypothetical protein COW64_21845, partial [bacterium (Candidatus Blackallbacteria) CG18_big_fil_WC_8_21_14_2_50_49_26]